MCAAQSVCLLNYNEDQANKLTTSGLFRHTALVVWSDRIHWGKKSMSCVWRTERHGDCHLLHVLLLSHGRAGTSHLVQSEEGPHYWPVTGDMTPQVAFHTRKLHSQRRHMCYSLTDTLCYKHKTSTLSHKEPHGHEMIVLISNTGDSFSVASWLALWTH